MLIRSQINKDMTWRIQEEILYTHVYSENHSYFSESADKVGRTEVNMTLREVVKSKTLSKILTVGFFQRTESFPFYRSGNQPTIYRKCPTRIIFVLLC